MSIFIVLEIIHNDKSYTQWYDWDRYSITDEIFSNVYLIIYKICNIIYKFITKLYFLNTLLVLLLAKSFGTK
jgi:hypothetical protein